MLSRRIPCVGAAAMILLLAGTCAAQVKIVDPGTPAFSGGAAAKPAEGAPPAMSKEEEEVAAIRRSLAEDRPTKAKDLADRWFDKYEQRYTTGGGIGTFLWERIGRPITSLLAEPDPSKQAKDEKRFVEAPGEVRVFSGPEAYVPEVLYLRGNAKLAMGDEWDALFDYEDVIKNYPESDQFVPCLERELQVARLYLNGRNKPGNLFGLRLDSGKPVGEELVLRICERLPGSRLAETSLLELADFYARSRDLELAAETYDVFLRLYPQSDSRSLAMQRRVYANIARFKGPGYDTATLKDAMVQIDEFQQEFPAEAQRSGVSDALQARVDESAAAGMLKNARWYVERGDDVSARLMLARLIRRHPRTGAAQEAVVVIQQIDVRSGAARADTGGKG